MMSIVQGDMVEEVSKAGRMAKSSRLAKTEFLFNKSASKLAGKFLH